MRILFPFLILFFGVISESRGSCNGLLHRLTGSEAALVLSAIGLGNPGAVLSSELIAEIEKVAGLAPGDLVAKRFSMNQVVTAVIEVIEEKDVDIGIGQQLTFLSSLTERMNPINFESTLNIVDDEFDFLRGFGVLLLPRNDPIFKDSVYLGRYLRLAGQSGVSAWGVDNSASVHKLFLDEWKLLAPSNVVPNKVFFQTGSDANNALYEVARVAASKRLGQPVDDAEILFFEGTYGAGRGRMMRNHYSVPSFDSDLKIPAPYERPEIFWDVFGPHPLEQLEQQALEFIRNRVGNSNGKPIGGLFLEPIAGAFGVIAFRSEFLLDLRILCDELRIPIFADEILTGGGRTGKFFAYQHFPGFEPDFLTYGKGFQLAGIATVNRDNPILTSTLESMVGQMNTITASSEHLLKAAFIMRRIREAELIDNARVVGSYFLNELHRVGLIHARGWGLLINPTGQTAAQAYQQEEYLRYMPYLTFTKEEVDAHIQKIRP